VFWYCTATLPNPTSSAVSFPPFSLPLSLTLSSIGQLAAFVGGKFPFQCQGQGVVFLGACIFSSPFFVLPDLFQTTVKLKKFLAIFSNNLCIIPRAKGCERWNR
jgi:hypothetical protein